MGDALDITIRRERGVVIAAVTGDVSSRRYIHGLGVGSSAAVVQVGDRGLRHATRTSPEVLAGSSNAVTSETHQRNFRARDARPVGGE
jgi:hypothetical protein